MHISRVLLRKRLHIRGLIGLCVVLLTFIAQATPSLAKQDDAYSVPNPLIISIADDYSPFTVIAPSGEPSGLLVDIWKLWSKYSGHPIAFSATDWSDTLQDVKDGRTHIHSGMFENVGRAKYFEFTKPIAEIPTGVFFLPGSPKRPEWVDDLKGQKVATIKASYQQSWLQQKYPEVALSEVRTNDDLVMGLLSGDFDAVVGEIPAIHASLAKIGMQGAVERTKLPIFTNTLLGAVGKGNGKLLELIEEGFFKVPVDDLVAVERRWLPDLSSRHFDRTSQVASLTKDEKAWLQDHRNIRVGVTTFIEPIDVVGADGGYTGFNADLMRMLSQQLGVHFVPVFHDTWGEVVKDAIQGKVDATLSLSRTPDRERSLLFTRPYAYDPIIVLTKEQDQTLKSWSDINGKRVSIVKGLAALSDVKDAVGKGEIIRVDNEGEGLNALVSGQVAAHISGLIPFANTQRKDYVPGVRVAVSRNSEGSTLRIATHKDNPILARILDKALSMISRKELQVSWNSWTQPQGDKSSLQVRNVSDRTAQPLELTSKEKKWIKSNPIIRVHNEKTWAPFNFYSAGEPKGYSIEYMDLLADKLGLQVDYVTGPTWNEFLSMVKEHRLDVMLNIVKTPEREKYIRFTKPFVDNPPVVIARQGSGIETFEDVLKNKILCIPSGFFYEEQIKSKYPHIPIRNADDQSGCLRMVSSGDADATMGGLAIQTYLISKYMLNNLTVAASINDPVLSNKLRLGVRSDWPVLQGLLNNAIAAVSEQERNALAKRWIVASLSQQDLSDSSVEESASLNDLLVQLAVIIGGFLLILSLLLVVYRYLVRKAEDSLTDGGSVVWAGVLVITLFLGGVVVATWLVLGDFEKTTRKRIESSLETILEGTQQSLRIWVAAEKKFVSILVADCQASYLVDGLVKWDKRGSNLAEAPYQEHIRELLVSRSKYEGAYSYDVLSPTGKVLASSYEKDIGKQSDISVLSPDRFAKAVQGGTAFIPPLVGKSQTDKERLPEVHFASAIKNDDGQILAVLVVGYPMSEAYSKIVSSGRLLTSGETYVLDRKGHMLSKSRFSDRLVKLGLVDKGNMSGFSRILVVNPGVDLHVAPEQALPMNARELTRMAKDVTKGRSGVDISAHGYRDYRGVPVFGAWVWDDAVSLGIAMEVDFDEAMGEFYHIRLIILSLVGGAVFIGLSLTAVTVLLGRRATQELERLVAKRTQELAVSQERSNLLLTSIGEGVFGTDVDGLIIFINPTACEMLGYEAEELLGLGAHLAFHHHRANGDEYPVEECPMFHAFDKGTVSRIDDEVLWRKDGSSFPVEYNATPMRQDGVIIGSVISFLDISERLEIQQQLQDREARIVAIMDNVADAIISIDENGMIESCNKAVKTIFGYTSEELIGVNVSQLMPLEIAQHHDKYLQNYAATGMAKIIGQGTREVTAIRKDGEQFPAELSVGEARVEGRRLFVGGMRDISERKQAQERLSQAFAVISDSIGYAARIQKSVLPTDAVMWTILDENFVIWEPRDVVGGDIYWGGLWGDGVLMALADCTGHGVPGAFMTLITAGALDRAMTEVPEGDVAALLTRVHQIVQIMLSQHSGGGESDDGLEMGLCFITPEMDRMRFAGARFSVFEVTDDAVEEIKGTKKGLGYRGIPMNQAYDTQEIVLKDGQTFVMATDGIIDQIGGETRRAFGKRRFKDVLAGSRDQSLSHMKGAVLDALTLYQGDERRRDDVAVLGFRIKDE